MPLVSYFFQGEPGESERTPNAFAMPNASSSSSPKAVTLGDFLKHFPPTANSSGGRLHFRFRAEDAKCGYVWQDVSASGQVLPTFKGQIMAKILCLDAKISSRRLVRLRRKQLQESGSEATKSGGETSTRRQDNYSSSSSRSSSSSSGGGDSTSRTSSDSIGSHRPPQGGGVGGGGSLAASAAESKSKPAANLMDFGSEAATATKPAVVRDSNHLTSDFESIDISSSPSAPAVAAVKLNRDDLVAKREAAIQEKVNQALEFKQELDENLKRESEELEAAKVKHDRNLTEWAFDQSKKKRNVRTLLSTMHKVLWADGTWKPVGLGDIIEPKKVKLQFRKAMLVVHPDRCTNLTAENRFVGKRVFEAINEAYQEFLKSESVE